MKESSQTLCFLGAAAAAVLIATMTRPSDATYEVSALIGKPLTKAFQPEEAKSLKILDFNEETATLRDFEVAEEDGVWSIPSQGGYPADAESQMADAATAVMDREILAIVSQSAADHEEYGVVEPSANLNVGQTGVGKRVTLAKGDGTALVDLIVGKEVKDEEDQRYVRRANQDVVYVVEIDDESLSTKFEDWIEDDLLDLSPWDISQVRIKDYTAELVLRGFQPSIEWDRRTDMTLVYDDEDSKWTAGELLAFSEEANEYQPFELSAQEELSEETLSELKSALDDLRIVDVESKPAGLSADLKAGDDFLSNNESVASLVRRGFAPVPMASGETEILSSEGEVIASLKTGVEYVLRFGNLQVSADESDDEPAASDGEAATPTDSGVNRYLFVSVRLNEDLIEKPELEELPELPEGSETAVDEDETADAPATEDEEDAATEEAAEDTTDVDADSDGETTEETSEVDELIAERKAIESRNQSALDDYQSKLKAAQERVDELNARFGDWYYVIGNDVYKKIRVSRAAVITEKEGAEEEADTASDEPVMPSLPDLGIDLGDAAASESTADEASADEASAEGASTDAAAEADDSE